jgi:excisionase family DNA binding protein
MTELLTIPDVARMLSLGVSTVRRMVATGEIDAIRIGPADGRIRVTREAVAEYLARKSARPAQPPAPSSVKVRRWV